MKTLVQKKWIQILHVAKRECSLDDDAYRALLWGACGVESAGEIKEWKQYYAALAAFKKLGFVIRSKTAVKSGFKKPLTQAGRNSEFLTARQEYYLKGLWDLASRKKDERSLRAMVKCIGKVDAIQFLTKEAASKVILALRDITEKAGYNPDEQTVKGVVHG